MKTKFILEVDGLTARGDGNFTVRDVAFKVKMNECWAITGRSGSGKSSLLKCIYHYQYHPDRIKFPEGAPRIVYIGHQNQFKNLAGVGNFYYQQRFNATEADDAHTVIEELIKDDATTKEAMEALGQMQIAKLKDTPLLQLSNGEHKRFQIARALLKNPDWILLDNAFTGLDAAARIQLEAILKDIMESGVHLLMASSDVLPGFVTHVAHLDDGILTGVFPIEKHRQMTRDKDTGAFTLPRMSAKSLDDHFVVAVEMRDVTVAYGNKNILSGINWTVKKGDRWCITGPNGSGKSTLLSLINGDNPQAFANDIYLFDRKRGTGETIWDIKGKIGFVSPELHHYFNKRFTCFQVVASGLFDTIGLFRNLNDEQSDRVYEYLRNFGLSAYAGKSLASLSFGLQRWVLLARALIKDPPLLILDEPCQGLDVATRQQLLAVIEHLCELRNITLIYVTHLEYEIPECITHFLKLENGSIKEIIENEKKNNGDRRRWHRA